MNNVTHHSSYYDDEFDIETFSAYFGLLDLNDSIIIRHISDDDDDRILESIKPKYIIIYHPDQALVRRVEVLKSLSDGMVFFFEFRVIGNIYN